MARDSIVNYTLDNLFSSTGIGSLDKAIGLNQYGINYSQAPTLVPRNKEQSGFVFFTRPQLNMQGDNIRNLRSFYNLLTESSLSQERVIRCLLDPRLGAGYRYGSGDSALTAPIITSPLVDNENAFIPMLTNNCLTLTGWPEEVMTTQKTKENVYRGVHTQPNGIATIIKDFTLNATFRNVYGNAVIKLIHYWILYMSATGTTGTLRPYPDFEAWDVLDCNTRIYRIVLDPQRERVTQIFATGAAIPVSNAVSAFADYNREAAISDVNKDFTISFECDGMIVMDPILFYTFNNTVAAFCPGMRDEYRNQAMVKLTKLEREFFKNIGYPRIDPQTSAFEIWVPADLYATQARRMEPFLNPDYNQSREYESEPEE